MVKYIVSIVYHATNFVRGLCVGGDIIILVFAEPAIFIQTPILPIVKKWKKIL